MTLAVLGAATAAHEVVACSKTVIAAIWLGAATGPITLAGAFLAECFGHMLLLELLGLPLLALCEWSS